jgi:probable HAF family extracellular repeat protein
MYEVIALSGEEASVQSHVVAVNDAGVVCGSRSFDLGHAIPALWSPNGLSRLLECEEYGGVAVGINNRGVVVGYEFTSRHRDVRRAIAWMNGERIVLPDLEGANGASDCLAASINTSGQIGGRSNGRYVLWIPDDSGRFTVTEISSAFSSYFGPNDNGVIAGRIGLPERGDRQQLGFWHRGTTTERAFPDVDGTWRYFVTGLNRLDQVLVTGSDDRYDDLGWFAVVSERREILVDRRRNGLKLIAHGLNDAGTVVGRAELSSGTSFPFLWTAGEPVDLNRLLPWDAGFTVFAALAITNSGTILACADDAHGNEHHVLLMPSRACRS